jgi:hypothetical protein
MCVCLKMGQVVTTDRPNEWENLFPRQLSLVMKNPGPTCEHDS